jgi:hypothetical protein
VIAGTLAFSLFLAVAPADSPVVTLQLSDGTRLVGRILFEGDGKLRLHSELLGEIDVPAASIVERTFPPPSPPPVSWTRSIGIGGSFVSAPFEQGVIDAANPSLTGKLLRLPGEQLQAQLTFSLLRSAARDRWSLTAGANYLDAEPAGRLTEAYRIESTYTRSFHGRDFVYTSTALKRDAVRRIDNSAVQVFGVGRRFIDTPSKKLDVLPGIAFQREEKGTRYDGDILIGYGFMESFTMTTPRGVAFEQRFITKTLLEDSGLYTIDAYVGVRAPLTKRLSLTAGIHWDHDEMLGLQQTVLPPNALFPGSPETILYANRKSTLSLTTGMQVSF